MIWFHSKTKIPICDGINNRSAFSLVELLVVLTIASLVAAVVTVNWSPALDKSSMTDAVERLIELDRQTIRHAITHNRRCSLEFDLRKNQVVVSRWEGGQEFFKAANVSSRCSVKSIEPDDRISISRFGSGPTYHVELEAGHGKKTWLLFAGGTGPVSYTHLTLPTKA